MQRAELKESFYIKTKRKNSLHWCHYKFISGRKTIIRCRKKILEGSYIASGENGI